MRTVLVLVTMVVATAYYAGCVLVAGLVLPAETRNRVYGWAPRMWAKWICRVAGVKVTTHGFERLSDGIPRILAANHVSWFDVFALARVLPRSVFIAKKELERIPVFGRAAREAGHLFIERQNRKAAFAQYEHAASRIRRGATIVVFPEGTRGYDYRLRPFKKGPFVLAIAAQVPITPILVHGSIEVQRKGSFRVRPNEIHLHMLDDIPTTGMTYEDRDTLARKTYEAMAGAQQRIYEGGGGWVES